MKRLMLCVLILAFSAACGEEKTVVENGGDGDGDGNGNGDGDGDGSGDDGNGGDGDGDGNGGDGDDCGSKLIATIRDFPAAHPDFENDDFMNESGGRNDMPLLGIVANELGADGKPVYTGVGTGRQTTSEDDFNDWYNDVDGVNQTFSYEIELSTEGDGQSVYANKFFFPIDGKGFGNEGTDSMGTSRNFFFTTEIHTKFEYKAGQRFTFIGDDDLWLFINGKLAIDLGGLHPEATGTVDLDAQAAALGITPGNEYTMDIFHAERHTTDSNFRVETSIDCIIPVVL